METSSSGEKAQKTTVFMKPELHRALKLKASAVDRSVSDLINEAVQNSLTEDAEDLADLKDRKGESTRDFSVFVQELRDSGEL